MAIFATDLEGPITLNDNAFELSTYFLEKGDLFFKLISRYDDVLADIVRREGYKAGDTLRLILPFFLAFGVGQREMEDFSARTLKFVPQVKEALSEISAEMPTFIISTSYEPYVQAVCENLSIPLEHAYCTRLDLDRYRLSRAERIELERLYREILKLPMIEIPHGASSLEDLSTEARRTISRLDEIFLEIGAMAAGRVLAETNPIGGREKVEALQDVLQRTEVDLKDLIYVGDSITDYEALELVRRGGGLAISFNGNRYALRAAEVAIISRSARPLATLARAFCRGDKRGVMRLIEEGLPGAKLTIDEATIRESETMRKRLRSEKVGELG
jgi:predicted HAD superfamily phosphohydrolase